MFLVFQLRAPLGAFGNAQAEIRHTSTTPRKSAVMGMLAAALGLERSQTSEFAALSDSLALGTAELREPRLLVDYHTVQSPAPLSSTSYDQSRADQLRRVAAVSRTKAGYKGTIVTQRAYLQDGHWLIVLAGPIEMLNRVREALERPTFTLYLGRKSCPLSAFTAPLLTQATTLEAALENWATTAGVELPTAIPLTWEPAITTQTPAATQAPVTDHRRTLQYLHFAPRQRREGVWNR